MFLLVLLHSFSKLFVCFLIFLIFDIFSSLSFIYLNILSMMVLYSLNNNLLFEAFVNMLLLSVFLLDFHYGANLFVCLVIFFFFLWTATFSWKLIWGTSMWSIMKMLSTREYFLVVSIVLLEASASPRPL